MVSESLNSSIFHQLAEQLQQQNLEQFQKQLMEHQQHQQKVGWQGHIHTHTHCLSHSRVPLSLTHKCACSHTCMPHNLVWGQQTQLPGRLETYWIPK